MVHWPWWQRRRLFTPFPYVQYSDPPAGPLLQASVVLALALLLLSLSLAIHALPAPLLHTPNRCKILQPPRVVASGSAWHGNRKNRTRAPPPPNAKEIRDGEPERRRPSGRGELGRLWANDPDARVPSDQTKGSRRLAVHLQGPWLRFVLAQKKVWPKRREASSDAIRPIITKPYPWICLSVSYPCRLN